MRTILLFILCLASFPALAQQDPLYSQYLLNPLTLNPAYAGLNNNLNAMASYRTQWVGIEGHPETLSASVHSSLVDNKVGAGLLLIADRIGNVKTTEAMASFAYKLPLNDETTFSFGMQAGIQNFRTDYSELNIQDRTDVAFLGGERGTRFNLGAGAILKSEKYLIGLSVPRLIPTKFENGGQEFQLYNQHFYLMGAYVHYLNEHIRLKPTVLLRGVKGAPVSVDLGFNINLNAIHTAGIFTRSFNTYGLLLQTLVKDKLRFGYVFEMPTNNSVGTSFSTHELTVGVMLSAFSFHERSQSNF